jgi:hypothetical protein
MSQLVTFTIKEGTTVTVEKKGGPSFAYTLKRDMAFLSFVRGVDVYPSEIGFRVNDQYTIWLLLRHVKIDNAEWCPKCDGRGTLTVSNWKPPQRCYRCAGKGIFTARDQEYHRQWCERRGNKEPDAQTTDTPMLF